MDVFLTPPQEQAHAKQPGFHHNDHPRQPRYYRTPPAESMNWESHDGGPGSTSPSQPAVLETLSGPETSVAEAAIGVLPNEVLTMAFAILVELQLAYYDKPRRPNPLGPLRLVCHLWEGLIVGTPELWTRIWMGGDPEGYVPEDQDDENDSEEDEDERRHRTFDVRTNPEFVLHELAVVELHINRSGTLPLRVSITPWAPIEALLPLIHRTASRWHSLSIFSYEADFSDLMDHTYGFISVDHALVLTAMPLVNVKYLRVAVEAVEKAFLDKSPILKFNCPALEHLESNDVVQSQNGPWTSLNSFTAFEHWTA